MGKELKNTLLGAGFVDIDATASFETFASAAEVAFLPRP